nr:ATP synthase subunit alpha-like [Lytechinus pictus]
MKRNASELIKIIEKRIANYRSEIKKETAGVVVSVSDDIIIAQGLPDLKSCEIVKIGESGIGIALVLEEGRVGIAMIKSDRKIQENELVFPTGETAALPISEAYLGRVIDPLGAPLDGETLKQSKRLFSIEAEAPSVISRSPVSEPLEVGILGIDALIPIGKGQRELIIGDRGTGKSSIAVSAIANQAGKDVISIYVMIGKKTSGLIDVKKKLQAQNAFKNVIIVAATASETEAMKYLAPFSAMAIAEYFMSKKKDVLIVFDDLTRHAKAYRSLSLLLGRSSGREAYPGDIFYLHSRLLERSAKLKSGGSITALPIVETQLQDISGYIPTNIISITDGQIFLDTDLFNSGFKPAISFGLSVSRVGSSAQTSIIKKTVGDLKLALSSFRELKTFSQFSETLDENTKKTLDRGEKIIEFLKQEESVRYEQ